MSPSEVDAWQSHRKEVPCKQASVDSKEVTDLTHAKHSPRSGESLVSASRRTKAGLLRPADTQKQLTDRET